MPDQKQNPIYWIDTYPSPPFPQLSGEIEVDVAIVGGGMVGVAAARLLKDAGMKVSVLEARRVGQGVSGKATAKVTSQHGGTKYQTLAEKFGENGAQIYAHAQESGIMLIRDLAAKFGIDCDLEEKAAFVYTTEEKEVATIEREVELAKRLGLPAHLTLDTGLPFDVKAAMRWDHQYQFHPVKFIGELAATIPGEGSHVFENSRVTDWDTDRVETAQGTVKAKHVLMATNLPLGQIGLYYSMNYPKAEAAIVAPIERELSRYYLSAGSPTRSVRTHKSGGRTYAIAVGGHFHPGHPDKAQKELQGLEQWLKQHFNTGEVEYRWINEDYTPMDGAPFVGWSSKLRDGYLVATGFDAWGFSNGAAAAMMICDLVVERENHWLELFDATRVKPVAGGSKFVHENMHVAEHLVNDYTSKKPKSYDELAPGEAGILSVDGSYVAAFRDESGAVHSVSAVCSHRGCLVGWNPNDRTWDCPCHGSRFELTGEVLHGPAAKALERKG